MDEKGRETLWEEYIRTRNSKLREQLIIEYAGLVKVVAGRMGMYLGYTVEYDDLVGYGVFGLIDAIDKFELTKGVKFETYASLRIRGSILDQIRKMDWIPRTLRQKQKKLDQAMHDLETQLGRMPTNEELAANLEISVDELDGLVNQAQIAGLVSLDEYLEQGSEVRVEAGNKPVFQQPEQVVERQELKRLLAEAIDSLTEKEQKVIALYYFEELTLKEISNILEVSESRVSQLHTKSLRKMREKLGDENMGVFGIWNI
jgi:RNA polymerase sigma factor for flagellar operon FliA